MFEDELPPTSRDEAESRRVRPPLDRYDPEKLSHWSITMTVAWIVWGDTLKVCKQWDNYRKECADWVFETDAAALNEVGRLAIRNLGIGELAPYDPDLDLRLQEGSWHFRWWKPAGWNQLYWNVYVDDIPPDDSIDALWLAAGEGKIEATAIECANEQTFDGELIKIPQHYWSRLHRRDDLAGKATLVGAGHIYRDIQFSRLDIKNLWPTATINLTQRDVTISEPASRDSKDPEEVYRRWVAQHDGKSPPSRTADLAHMRLEVGKITIPEVRDLRRDIAPDSWKLKGRRASVKK
jgi:hypothetical protein